MPKKEAEAPKYAPLTKEEKQRIMQRHKELVDRMNQTLPDGMKLKYDENLEKRLDDPKEVGLVRIAQEMEERKNQQRKIEADLESRFGKCKIKTNLSRAFFYELDTSGTPEANAYNERLYKDYIENPDKVIFLRYGKLLETDPTGIYNCDDDPLKLAEYYKDTYPLCEEGFVFDSVVGSSDLATPDMRVALKGSLVKPMETIGYPVNMMRAAAHPDFLACPKMTMEQVLLIENTDREFMLECGEGFKRVLDETLVQATVDTPKTFFGKFIERGIPLQQGMFAKLRAESYDLDANGNPINIQEAKFDQVLSGPGNSNKEYRIAPRPDANLLHVSSMNKSFEKHYLDSWQKKFSQKQGRINEFNVQEIENAHKGGWWERHIPWLTSKQYKQFMQAFKDYNNPESEHYLDKAHLKAKGEAYMAHKARQGKTSIERARGTDKIRMQLVTSTIEACDETTPQSVAKEWLKDYSPEIKREPFLKAEAVAEESLEAPNKEKAIEKNIEVEKEKAEPEIQGPEAIQ